jgi:ATP-dependent HslUV protease ATP-binding subunit HslU
MEIGLTQAKERVKQRLGKKAEKEVETRLLDMLVGNNAPPSTRDRTREQLRKGELEENFIDIEMPERTFSSPRAGRRSGGGMGGIGGIDLGIGGGGPKSFSFSSGIGNGGGGHDSTEGPGSVFMDLGQLVGNFPRSKKRKLTIAEGRPILIEQETERLMNQDVIFNEAKEMVEQNGIVFIDEIDKICVPKHEAQFKGDASDEGVQRDLLPLIEGTSVTTRYGNIDTSKILFIASGAFHSVSN